MNSKNQEIGIKFTITDCSNFDKRCSSAHFVSFLFYYIFQIFSFSDQSFYMTFNFQKTENLENRWKGFLVFKCIQKVFGYNECIEELAKENFKSPLQLSIANERVQYGIHIGWKGPILFWQLLIFSIKQKYI